MASPQNPVLVCEGEKAADTATKRFIVLGIASLRTANGINIALWRLSACAVSRSDKGLSA